MPTYYRANVNWSVHPDIEEARRVLEREASRRKAYLLVNSANDSQHGGGTLHNNINKINPEGKAFDIERKPFKTKNDVLKIIGKGSIKRGNEKFDVVSYPWGFHIEYDPK